MLGSGDKLRDKVSSTAEESSLTDLDPGVWDVLMRSLSVPILDAEEEPEVQRMQGICCRLAVHL